MEQKLLSIFNTILQNKDKTPLENLNRTLTLREDLGLDSLDLAELTVRIESEFDVDVFKDGFVNSIDEIMVKLNS
jgi:acyl carrier protein